MLHNFRCTVPPDKTFYVRAEDGHHAFEKLRNYLQRRDMQNTIDIKKVDRVPRDAELITD